jgi:hypothetical protein
MRKLATIQKIDDIRPISNAVGIVTYRIARQFGVK